MKIEKYVVYVLMVFSVILFFIISKKAQAALIVSMFIVVNMLITSYKKFIKIPIEVEVLTVGIVICTLKFGLKAGLVVAILGGILSFFVGLEFSPIAFPMFLGYILMAFVSYALRTQDLILVGIVATLINNLVVFLVYHFLFNYDIIKNLRFGLSNIALNLILFFNLAPILFTII